MTVLTKRLIYVEGISDSLLMDKVEQKLKNYESELITARAHKDSYQQVTILNAIGNFYLNDKKLFVVSKLL